MRFYNTFALFLLKRSETISPAFHFSILSDVAPEHIAAPDAGDIDTATVVHASPGPIRGAQLDDKVQERVQRVLALGCVVEKISNTRAPQSPQCCGIILVLRLGECQVEDEPYDLVPA